MIGHCHWGYAAPLSSARWLAHVERHSGGDIDAHGLAVLDPLRTHVAPVQALLMDRPTLMAHAAPWGEEPHQLTHDLPRRRPSERDTHDPLRDNRIRPQLRLAQERVGHGWLREALTRL